MKGSYRIGGAFGIGIFVHWSFPLLLFYVLFSSLGSGLVLALNAVVFVLAIFGCVLLHELGHSLAARRYGIGTHDITLLPIGGVARLMRLPDEPRQELVIAIAGPAVNLVIAAVLSLVVFILGNPVPTGLAELSSDTAILYGLISANLILIAFNMIPAFPMDGGRVLRALLAMKMGMLPATEIAAGFGKIMAILMFCGAFFLSPLLFITAVFIYVAGEAELQSMRRNVAGRADFMDTVMRRLSGAFAVRDGFVYDKAPRKVRGRIIEPKD